VSVPMPKSKDLLDRKCSEGAAADRYQVLRTSLQDRIKAIKQGDQITLKPKLGRFQQTFNKDKRMDEKDFLPPMFILPRKKMDKNGQLMIGAPPESIGVACESGWMNAKTFLRWLHHFKQHVHSSKARPVLLTLDGHNRDKELKRDNQIHMLSTPPHTTLKL
ncbi:hypothetical protein ILUMI_23249, partial [Ignelater luminosus]